MYHKVKNTLAGLGMVAAFVAGGLFFSEPVPAETLRPMGPAISPEQQQAALALTLVKAAVVFAQAELAEDMAATQTAVETSEAAIEPAAAGRRGSQLRMQVGMPYYSFGALLPRRRES